MENTSGTENTSGMGPASNVPAEIDRWNWGAFLLNWIWGIGNDTFIALLMFVPLVNLVMPFVLGAKGSAWAWRNKRWESVAAFRATQRKWAQWGLAILVLSILLAVMLFTTIQHAMKHSAAYELTVKELNASPAAVSMLGHPITTGFPMGSIEVSGSEGEANLSFSADGPNGHGRVYVLAKKSLGQWTIKEAVLEDAATHKRVVFAPCTDCTIRQP